MKIYIKQLTRLFKILQKKRGIVVERDATTNILPNAEVKIVLSADIEAH
ncbi:2192_t:CDS:1, partial [Racocetra persica]